MIDELPEMIGWVKEIEGYLIFLAVSCLSFGRSFRSPATVTAIHVKSPFGSCLKTLTPSFVFDLT